MFDDEYSYSYDPDIEQMQLDYERMIEDEINEINAELNMVEDYSDEYLSKWLLT